METFRHADTSPKEEFCYHNAGASGRGTASYIDLVAFRDKDANTAWTSASDGVLEERRYVCQNWRADVVSIVTNTGTMQEWDKYSAYGVGYGIPGGDTNTDFATNTTDVNQVQTWINGSTYDVRGDIDLDGDVDATDKTTIRNTFAGITLGRGVLSQTGVANRKGYAGYEGDGAVASKWHVRNRVLDSVLGRWLSRDAASYIDGLSLYAYVASAPESLGDPTGRCDMPLPTTASTPPPTRTSSGSSGQPNQPPPDLTESEKGQCCRDAKQQGVDIDENTHEHMGGSVICCKGHQVGCNWEWQSEYTSGPLEMSDDAAKMVEACVTKHELTHMPDLIPCDPNDMTLKLDKAPSKSAAMASEVKAYKTSIDCFSSWNCKQDFSCKVWRATSIATAKTQIGLNGG